jgi:hypothetical protein
MQGINQSYTMYFNRRYDAVGHLFQGRYKAILCDRDRYQLSLVKYIHLNPVRAGIVARPEEYPWSSHPYYLLPDDETGMVDTAPVLEMFSEEKEAAHRLYRVFMDGDVSIPRDEAYATVEQRILGDEHFVEQALQKNVSSLRTTKRDRDYTLGEIAGAIEESLGVSLEEIRSASKSRRIASAKRLMSLVAHEYGYRGIEIARFINKDPVVVTRHLRGILSSGKEVEGVVNTLKNSKSRQV